MNYSCLSASCGGVKARTFEKTLSNLAFLLIGEQFSLPGGQESGQDFAVKKPAGYLSFSFFAGIIMAIAQRCFAFFAERLKWRRLFWL
jgi:hypothetical protein